jgi:hypothetical protein
METTKLSFEFQIKGEKDKFVKKEAELERLKSERLKWETRAQAVEAELNVNILSLLSEPFTISSFNPF